MTHVTFLLQAIRAQGYSWREEDVRDRFGEWSRLIGAAADEAAYWMGGADVGLESISDDESLIDLLDQIVDVCQPDEGI